MSEPTYHPEELEAAKKEKRPVLGHRLFRYDHLPHNIELGTLVDVAIEVNDEDSGGAQVHLKGRCRVYVVEHNRDCDGEPLYTVSDMPVTPPAPNEARYWMYRGLTKVFQNGMSESALRPTRFVQRVQSLEEYFSLLR